MEFVTRADRQREWRKAHRDEINERERRYRETHRDEIHERYNEMSTHRLREKTLRKFMLTAIPKKVRP